MHLSIASGIFPGVYPCVLLAKRPDPAIPWGMSRVLAFLTAAFPLWILLCSGIALWQPALFTWFLPWIVWGLGIIMLGMGLTLTFEDFRKVLALPWAGVVGVVCQFVIMPTLGWGVGRLLGLAEIDPSLAVGLILVACCPGGTASNVIAYLAKANVALSVMMTTVSTCPDPAADQMARGHPRRG